MGIVSAIGGALALGGAIIGSKSQNKAANTAANAQRDASEANAQVQREQLQAATQRLDPYAQRGNAAGNAINALLGLGGTAPAQSLPTAQPNALTQFARYQGPNPDSTAANPYSRMGIGAIGNTFDESVMPIGRNGGYGPIPQMTGIGAGAPGVGGQAPQGQTAQQAASNAFDIFRNSTGYQFRLGEGMNAINSGYAGAGTLQSGAAMKAINEYGQNFASNEFGNYMGYLGNQQGVGLGAASAVAGVGQNYANNIQTNNNALAGALGNAALVRGANNPFANALGMIGGTILGSR